MKIFNKEQNKEKVYVQMNNIIELTQSSIPIPESIINKIIGKEMLIVNDSNRDIFVEFDDPNEIEFFKSIEWILDYKKYRYLTQEELKLLFEDNIKESNDIVIKYNQLSYEEKLNDTSLHARYNIIQLKNKDIKKLYFMKTGEYQPPIPLVPDSDGFSLENDNLKDPYKLSASLNPNKYLFYRVDGEKLQKDENVPGNFINTGLCLAFMNRKDIPKQGDCEISYSFNPDNKYLVINTKFIEKEDIKTPKTEEAEKGFKKVLNKLLNKKKKS